ncbi:hypothetical protein CWB77_18375, partial [Pseudoalteromonas sp. S1610]
DFGPKAQRPMPSALGSAHEETSETRNMRTTAALPTVLLVDDEARATEAMRRTLVDEFRVLDACSADEARRLLESDSVD